jgi:hypothetical protein
VIGAAQGYYPPWALRGACLLLLVANGFNIAADLAGMAEVTELLSGLPHAWLIPMLSPPLAVG